MLSVDGQHTNVNAWWVRGAWVRHVASMAHHSTRMNTMHLVWMMQQTLLLIHLLDVVLRLSFGTSARAMSALHCNKTNGADTLNLVTILHLPQHHLRITQLLPHACSSA